MTKVKSARLGQERKIGTRLGDVLMSNTVYVNKNYAFNDLHKMVFVTLPMAMIRIPSCEGRIIAIGIRLDIAFWCSIQ